MKPIKTKTKSAYVITQNLPDGKNYWCGLQQIKLPNGKTMDTDFWSVWRNEAIPRGIFLSWGECDFYRNTYLDKSYKIEIFDPGLLAFLKWYFIRLISTFLFAAKIRNKWFGIDLFYSWDKPRRRAGIDPKKQVH